MVGKTKWKGKTIYCSCNSKLNPDTRITTFVADENDVCPNCKHYRFVLNRTKKEYIASLFKPED